MHSSTRVKHWVEELFLLIVTHTGVYKTLCTDSNLRPGGGCHLYLFVSTVCLSWRQSQVFCVPSWAHLSGKE